MRVAERILGLKQEVQLLEGLLPNCSYCKKIQGESDEWTQIESYIAKRSDASFSRTICPVCYEIDVKEELMQLEANS